MSTRVLVIDDEPSIRELIALTLEPQGMVVTTAGTRAEGQARLADPGADLVLTDLRLPDGDGLDLVRAAVQHAPAIPVAVITAYGTPEGAVTAMRLGAFDYLSKPIDTDRLRSLASHGLQLARTSASGAGAELVGESTAMQGVRDQIARVARSEAPVLVSGESGTGKELAARAIHTHSLRSEGPFIPVNCAAIPEHLIESELFGYRKGAFTGATADKRGLFQEAEGGTLFLDEVGDLGLAVQANLLRALQERAVRPLGATREVPVDVRIIAATHRELEEAVAEGRFREDLFYRLDVLQVAIPPLRAHPDDIPALATHLLERRFAGRTEAMPSLSAEAMERLRAQPLKGNVRELENLLERALSATDGPVIPGEAIRKPRASLEGSGEAVGDEADLDSHLAEVEAARIRSALEQAGGNKSEAARGLGITLRSLRYRIEKLGLE